MKVSHKWLNEYFSGKLPSADKVAEALTMHAFEIEEVFEQAGDYILDVKVLPNRAHDCLSHRGIAKEISSILNIKIEKDNIEKNLLPHESPKLKVEVESKLVPRFTMALIENIKVVESPSWLKEKIESMGGRSINNIVDITNYVMFELGQPMHAFDADKLKKKDGTNFILVREAKDGEKTITLDKEERTLGEGMILISDGNDNGSILGIAGIKGGMEAGIDENTKNILLEAANFNPENIRKSSKKLNLRTDASVRFENGISPEWTMYAVSLAIKIISECANDKSFKVDSLVDLYKTKKKPYRLGVSLSEVNGLLGTNLKNSDLEGILNRYGFEFAKVNPEDQIENTVKALIGRPYKSGASISVEAPDFFDCSSFVSYSFIQAGISIPRMTVDQMVYSESILEGGLKELDLVFSNTGIHEFGILHHVSKEFMPGVEVKEGVDHVGIYIGNGEVVHASKGNNGVKKEKISESNYFKNIVGYGRILKNNEERFIIEVPFERLDLRLPEDLIEEVGRLYGLAHIESVVPQKIGDVPKNDTFSISQIIRRELVNIGFSEVYTYAMVEKGKVEIANPIANDKSFMRENIKDGLIKSYKLNSYNAPLLNMGVISIFEIGSVFTDLDSEHISLSLLSLPARKGKSEKKESEERLSLAISKMEDLGIKLIDEGDGVYSANISKVQLRESDKEVSLTSIPVVYKSISVFPFILRDIAFWTLSNVNESDVEKQIRKDGGEDLIRCDLFDKFEKDGKVSLAYHLVFQSKEKTLTDEEVNKNMDDICSSLKSSGFEIR